MPALQRLAGVVAVALAAALLPAAAPAEVAAPASAAQDGAHLIVVEQPGGLTAYAAGAESLPGPGGTRAVRLPVAAHADVAEVAARLAAREGVVAVEAPRPLTLHRAPNAPRLDEQWGVRELGIDAVWARGRGQGRTVAVVDTGVDATADLPARRIRAGWDFLAGAPHRGDVEPSRHGTAVAHIAAATGDNGIGTAGACWECDVLPVVVLDGQERGTTWELAQGIRYAVDAGADVINLSVGTSASDRVTRAAVGYAAERGVPVVASAGNSGLTSMTYPAGYPEVIGVAGVEPGLRLASNSNRGDWVDLAAPWCHPVGDHGQMCGTSSSAPVVAGALTSIRSASPATADALRAALTSTAIPVDGIRHGALAAGAALASLPGQWVTSTRLAGEDRYETAAEASRAGWPDGSSAAIVATGMAAPDALAAGAASLDAPVLLTRLDRIPPATTEELRRLRPAQVYLVGGTAAVSEDVRRELARVAPVRRVAGDDRYGTAAELAALRPGDTDEVWIVPGTEASVALAGAAEAARAGAPVLLAREGALPGPTVAALAELGASSAVLFGGPPSVAAAAAEQGLSTRRSGPDEVPAGGVEALLATSQDFPDALAGSALAARLDAPLLQSRGDRLDAVAASHVAVLRPAALRVLGGERAIAESTVRDAVDAAAVR